MEFEVMFFAVSKGLKGLRSALPHRPGVVLLAFPEGLPSTGVPFLMRRFLFFKQGVGGGPSKAGGSRGSRALERRGKRNAALGLSDDGMVEALREKR